MKKIFAAALALTLTFGSFVLPAVGSGESFADKFAFSASAESYGDYNYTVLDDGTVEISKYIGNDINITIPSTLNGKKVTSIGEYAFYYRTAVKSITIPDSVKNIDEFAFFFCTGLESIAIPNSVTNIGASAFNYCKSLSDLTISENVKEIGSSAFKYCDSLTEVIIPSSVLNIGEYAFGSCTSLKTLVISDGVKTIGVNAFAECTNLKKVQLPKSLTSIGEYAFAVCNSLSDVYYTGGKSEFEKLSINLDNSAILFSTMHYNSHINVKRKISACTISLPTGMQYFRGTRIRPVVTIKDGTKTLKSGTDYTASYTNNLSVGTATVKITGKGSYAGTVTKTFDIVQRSLANCDIKLGSDSFYFNGNAIKPSVKVYCNGTEMYRGNYTIVYNNNISAGTASLTLTGKKNLKGTVTKTFKINPRNIGNCTVELTKNAANKYKPNVAVKIGTADVSSGNYTVKYTTSSDKKTVKVTLTGKDDLSGTAVKVYTVG